MDDIKLTPTYIFYTRTVNGHLYKFWLDGYIDQNSELYYTGNSLAGVEEKIEEMENEKNLIGDK